MRQFIAVAALLAVVGLPAAYLSVGGTGGIPVPQKQSTVAPQSTGEQDRRGMLDWLVAGVGRMETKDQSYRAGLAIDPKLVEARGRGVDLPSGPAFQFKSGASMVSPTGDTLITPKPYKRDEAAIAAGIERGRAAAFAYAQYRLAVDPEDPDALYALARYYVEGYKTPEGFAAAFRLMLAAAERGQIRAAHDVAVMYRDEVGVHSDKVLAYAWLTIAMLGTSDPARRGVVVGERDALAAQMTEGEVEIGEARVPMLSLHEAALAAPHGGLRLIGG